MCDLFNGPHIINMSKSLRLSWLGHVECREGTILNRMYRANIGGRIRGRLRKTWLGDGGFERYVVKESTGQT